ncbi:MAG: beta-lactamase, partial [Nocardioides sp.]|nr:beta-lactamase [Nocardioides sp.]
MSGVRGDEALAAQVRDLLSSRHRVVGAATLTPGRTRVAAIGAALDADFEIGSVSKGVTGLLYADALARGEVTGSTRLGDLLPLGDSPAAGVTLGTLATHRSGLPRLAPASHVLRGSVALWRTGANPYGQSLADLVVQTRTAEVGRARPRYSNFGFQLLGHAVAAAAGSSYADLVRDRLAVPLGLGSVSVPSAPDQLGPGAVAGTARR